MTDQKPSHKIIEAAFIIPESFFISVLRLHLRSAFRNREAAFTIPIRALYTSSVIPVRPATGGRIEALHGGF